MEQSYCTGDSDPQKGNTPVGLQRRGKAIISRNVELAHHGGAWFTTTDGEVAIDELVLADPSPRQNADVRLEVGTAHRCAVDETIQTNNHV